MKVIMRTGLRLKSKTREIVCAFVEDGKEQEKKT